MKGCVVIITMCSLNIERQQEALENKINQDYINALYILVYDYDINIWDFTLINPRHKTMYLPFSYKRKRINYSFYYQFLYRKLRRKQSIAK